MEKALAVLQVIVPIFVVVLLGVYARCRAVLTGEQVHGLQQFVVKFCLPCVLFISCLSASIEPQAITSMLCAVVTVFCGSLLAFQMRRKVFPQHNLPMLFAAQESGMLGIPLYMTLFGAEAMFCLGVLDVAQAFVAIPVIALLTIDPGQSASVLKIIRNVLRSPLLLAALAGLFLNLSGAMEWMNELGFGAIVTETTSFLAQPVSAAMLFSVGYSFSLDKENRQKIFHLSALHFGFYGAFGALAVLVLATVAHADNHTIWAAILYWTLPASYLSPSLARKEEEAAIAAGVCSLLTVISLIIFCLAAILNA